MAERRKDSKKAAAAKARAEALSPARRREIARKASEARWSKGLPSAGFEGQLPIGEVQLSTAVLDDETRIVTLPSLQQALGIISPRPGSTGKRQRFSEILRRFADADSIVAIQPVVYRTKAGDRGVGYSAESVRKIIAAYLNDELLSGGDLRTKTPAPDFIRRLASIDIGDQIDETTGFGDFRRRRTLQAVLETFSNKRLVPWLKALPDDFFKEMYRLWGWDWLGRDSAPQKAVAELVQDFIFARLPPSDRREIEHSRPDDPNKNRSGSSFGEGFSHPKHSRHVFAVTVLMKAARDSHQFTRMIDRALPKAQQH